MDLTPRNIYTQDGMLILALTRKGQESFSGQVPKDDQQEPVTSSSSQVTPKSSSSKVVASSSSQVFPTSSSSVFMGIPQERTQLKAKEPRGTVNAKGAHVKDVKNRYRVNFRY